MKKRAHLILFALVMVLANISFLVAKENAKSIEVPVKDITIELPAGFMPQKAPVTFPHSSHLLFSCQDCHHNWDLVSPIQGCMTAGCHERMMPYAPNERPMGQKKVMSAFGAYHKACRSCHREQFARSGQKNPADAAAPMECAGCHFENTSNYEYSMASFTLPLGNITLSAPEDVTPKRKAVDFPHALHFARDCQTCHHNWDGDSEIEGCMAGGCHDLTEPESGSRSINDPANAQYYLAAYHKACYQCHKDLKKANEELARKNREAGLPEPEESLAPVKCGGCHNVEE